MQFIRHIEENLDNMFGNFVKLIVFDKIESIYTSNCLCQLFNLLINVDLEEKEKMETQKIQSKNVYIG